MRGLLVLAVALFVSPAAPQESPNGEEGEGPRWFRVELVVFANLSREDHLAERWDPLPDLDYPAQYRFLVDPEAAAHRIQELSGTGPRGRWSGHEVHGAIDERGRLIVTLLPPPLPVPTEIEVARPDSFLAPPPVDAAAETPQDPATPPPPAVTESETGAGEEPSQEAREGTGLLTPVPFVTLSEEQRNLSTTAGAMQRSGRYDILFHEAWVQPFRERQSSVPLVLDESGDSGNWSRLQGSITLYLSRYLHLVTDLWLNTEGDYLERHWQMPAAPLGPPRHFVDRSALERFMAPVRPDALMPGYQPPLPVRPDAILADPAVESADTEGDYPWRHAVRLDQERRMRSGELHYIDHPMLGLLIRIDPVEPEELDRVARERALPWQDIPPDNGETGQAPQSGESTR